jgi:anti-anti-sigma factor
MLVGHGLSGNPRWSESVLALESDLDLFHEQLKESFMLKVYKNRLEDCNVLYLQGRLVTGETDTLREAVASQTDGTAIILDLRRVNRIDARGLGVLLQLREQTLARGMKFKLINVSRLLRQVFEITCLSSVFEISLESAPPAMQGRSMIALEKARCA